MFFSIKLIKFSGITFLWRINLLIVNLFLKDCSCVGKDELEELVNIFEIFDLLMETNDVSGLGIPSLSNDEIIFIFFEKWLLKCSWRLIPNEWWLSKLYCFIYLLLLSFFDLFFNSLSVYSNNLVRIFLAFSYILSSFILFFSFFN